MSALQRPSVSVIIPVRDGAAQLDGCLGALDVQDYDGDLEVLVVDNGSREDIGAVVSRHAGARMLREPRPGSYAARNLALTSAVGEVLAFTDGDCTPRPDWVGRAVEELSRDPAADMVGGRVEITYSHGAPRTPSELFEAVHGFPQERYLADQRYAVTANMITWRHVVDRVGPFDAALASRGDANWGQRVAAAGGTQRYAGLAVVRHPARSTWGESLEKWRRVARGRVANDLNAGRRPRHFVGMAVSQLRDVARLLPRLSTTSHLDGRGQRARYLLAFTVCRGLTAAIFARGAVASSLRRSSSQTASSPYAQ